MSIDAIKKEVTEDVKGGISCIFDGTPHVAECFALVLRYVLKGNVTHRLVALQMFKCSFTGVQLASQVFDIVVSELGIRRERLRAENSDGCSVNLCAMDNLKLLVPHLLNPICVTHGASIIGKIMLRKDNCPLPLARKLESLWSNLMTTSPRARGVFFDSANESAKRSSEIRFYCAHEILCQVYDQSAAVNAVIMHASEFAPEIRAKLRDLIAPAVLADLRMELAVAKM